MVIGKIVKSNSHIDYVCQVYGPGEVQQPPSPGHYAFGTFVRVELLESRWLVGIIHNTLLHNPEFGRLGPRLSPKQELAVFTPDYLNEKATLVGIAAVGTMNTAGQVVQGVPSLAASSDALVERMTGMQIRSFHQQEDSPPRLAYAPLLLAQGSPLAPHLLSRVVAQLMSLFPEEIQLLTVIQDDLIWKTQIGPLGGVM